MATIGTVRRFLCDGNSSPGNALFTARDTPTSRSTVTPRQAFCIIYPRP